MDMKEWVYFVQILANRYQGQGINYEIESEVNETASWKGTQEEYLELLKAGYEAIKKADPKAKVLPSAIGCGITRDLQLGSGARDTWRWHDRWLQAILSSKQFDVVSVHDYYFPSEIVANGLTFRSYLEHIRDVMRKSGLGNVPIWITETGFVSLPGDAGGRMDNGSPEKQAKWLTEAYQQAFELGVERVYWSALRDRKELYFGSMGLADAKGDPRPAWNALSHFSMGKEGK
jgi:exo-beta-1,3-glucanase (GH17 family)